MIKWYKKRRITLKIAGGVVCYCYTGSCSFKLENVELAKISILNFFPLSLLCEFQSTGTGTVRVETHYFGENYGKAIGLSVRPVLRLSARTMSSKSTSGVTRNVGGGSTKSCTWYLGTLRVFVPLLFLCLRK